MSFEIGDKIICINNDTKKTLEIEKDYTVSDYFMDNDVHIIKLKEIPLLYYCVSNFISVNDYRELKINKLKNKING
jgi:hypothetical protein